MLNLPHHQKTGLLVAAIITIGALLAALIMRSGPPQPSAAAPSEADHATAPHDDTVRLTAQQSATAGIRVARAGPADIISVTTLAGEIRWNQDRTAHVVPRVSGVVDSVATSLGQQVRRGQLLAVITSSQLSDMRSEWQASGQRRALASRTADRERRLWLAGISAEQDYQLAEQQLHESEIAERNARNKLQALGAGTAGGALGRYELRAPFDGMVVEKHLVQGESIKEDSNVFTISDLATVWAEINVTPRDLQAVRVGAAATVRAATAGTQARGTVAYVGAMLGEQNRSALARVTLANPDLAWRPGLFVTADVHGAPQAVALAVPAAALFTVEGKTSVFVPVDGGYAARPVLTGRSDGKLVEITQGLRAGDSYVAAGGNILKAELSKGGASHAH